MDFEIHYTETAEALRKEVRAFVEDVKREMPADLNKIHDPYKRPVEHWDFLDKVRRRVARKGWYAPTWPKEYGGGGLSIEESVVIEEEFNRGPTHMSSYRIGLAINCTGLLEFGTEEQKRRLLYPVLHDGDEVWECFTEREAGSDEAAMTTNGVRDGKDFIVNGEKLYVGEEERSAGPDWLYTPMVTLPDKPRHENLSSFYIPARLPGIEIEILDLHAGEGMKHKVTFKNVRVSEDYLIGKEGQGWWVSQATLSAEHGAGGAPGIPSPTRPRALLPGIIDYCQKTMRNGQPMSKDRYVRDRLVDIYIDSQISRLFSIRNWWNALNRQGEPWMGPQVGLYGKLFNPKAHKEILEMLGPQALVNDPEYDPFDGKIEYTGRLSYETHIAGTPEMMKLLMGRLMGVSRPPKRPTT